MRMKSISVLLKPPFIIKEVKKYKKIPSIYLILILVYFMWFLNSTRYEIILQDFFNDKFLSLNLNFKQHFSKTFLIN